MTWKLAPLKKITTKIGSGATPRGGNNSYKTEGITLIRSLNVYDFEFSYGGLAFINEEQASETRLARVIVEPQDILLNITGASVARCCIVPEHLLPARVNQHVSLVRVDPNRADSHYVLYCINSPVYKHQLLALAQGGATREALTQEIIGNLEIPLPPIPIQRKIANFLEHKTQQINELIRIKQRRIELLQEQRTALINQAVTKGLDPNVEMKPSGVEWIGEIPAHWEIGKIKHIATFVSEKSNPETDAIRISPENVESETGKILDFYSSYDSVGVKFKAGDVLFNKLRVYLSKVVFANYNGYSLGEMIVIRPFLQDMGKYLFYLMLSSRFIEYCNAISYGVKMPRTAVDDILNAQIPMTSDQEQIQIANFLNRKTEQIAELIAAEHQKIELLKEYRQSLISEVVTGKIDVRSEV